MHFSGIVQKISAFPYRGKNLMSFTLQGTQGFFQLGEKSPSFLEGQSLEFSADAGKRANSFNVDFSSIKVVQGNTQTAGTPAQVAAGNVTPIRQRAGAAVRTGDIMSKDDYWRRREERDLLTQKRIERQSCRNSAIALASVLYDGVDINEKQLGEFVGNWTEQYLNENDGTPTAEAAPQVAVQTAGEWK